MSTFNFQVNLEGIIDILSNHLYSEEKVFVRELMQNCTDAISARQKLEPDFKGIVRIDYIAGDADFPAQLVFEDNGIGLTTDEVHKFLSSIGSSSKRIAEDRRDFIGQFGIGLLSCFMITDEIVVITQSAKGGKPVEWRGNTNGSYTIREMERKMEPGTKIYLRCKKGAESFYSPTRIKQLVKHYGDLLPFPIFFGNETQALNEGFAPFEKEYANDTEARRAIMQYGKEQFEIEFFDYIPLKTEDGKTQGVAFILPFKPGPGTKMTHRVYLKRMLVAENADDILPEWAFFVKCIVNTEVLRPTASRESFYEDRALAQFKTSLGDCLKGYMTEMAKKDPARLQRFIRIHSETLKALALHDDDFFKLIINWIPFPSTIGVITIPEFYEQTDTLRFITDIDEFRQVAGIATAQDMPLINAGYMYDGRLIKKYGMLNPKNYVTQVTPESFIHHLTELSTDERNLASDFLSEATYVLRQYSCAVEIKKFAPTEVPTLYSMDKNMNFLRTAQKSKEVSDNVWGNIMDNITEDIAFSCHSKLCFNYDNPLVQRLIKSKEEMTNELFIKILYVQSLLLGMHPLNREELSILNSGLSQLMEIGSRGMNN